MIARRLLAWLSPPLLLATTLATARPAAADSTDAGRAGARWLVGELSGGALPGFAGPDWGLTIDALLALSATHADDGALETVTNAVARHVRAYNSFDDLGIPGVRIAGSTAKLLTAAVASGKDPVNYGGFDLRAETLALVTPSGRVSDVGTDDSSNTFGQSFAVLGLARSGGAPGPVVDFLRRQQCASGGFRLFPDAGTCDDATNVVLDPDSTAMAVQALYAAGVMAAADRGVAWLRSVQRADGSFGGSGPTAGANANSTGLAAQALAAGGETAAATRAAGWLAAHQIAAGAVAYNDESLAAGLSGNTRDQWRRATAQAVLGLAGVPLGDLGPDETPTDRLAGFLVAGLTGGDHVEITASGQTFTDYGQTADVAYALLASGRRPETLARILAFLGTADHVGAYAHGAPFDKPDAHYVGATAKLALLFALAGRNPRAVGGFDLIAELTALRGTGGRFADDSSFGNFANVFGQSFAVLALTAAGEPAGPAVAALIAASCADHSYPVDFPAKPCASGTPDSTGLAIQALNAGTGPLPAARHDALVAAVKALVAGRDRDGAWPGPGGQNTNSTGYATMGLLAVGQPASTSRAWLASVQRSNGGLPVNPGKDANLLASAQATPAFAGRSLLTIAPVLGAAERVPEPPPTTPPATPSRPHPSATPTSAAPPAGSGGGGSLPATGSSAGLLAVWAVVLVGVGVGLSIAARRRRRV